MSRFRRDLDGRCDAREVLGIKLNVGRYSAFFIETKT